MPYNQGTARWMRKGDYLDLEAVPADRRPAQQGRQEGPRFAFVQKQRVTNIRPVEFGTFVSAGDDGSTAIGGRTGDDDRLEPDNKNQIFQCAVGLKNNFKLWMEHPVDHSVGQLPNEVPNKNDDVGMIRMDDSPYETPSLDETEFWVVKDIADSPTFRAVKQSDGPIEPVIAVRANILVMEPVTDSDLTDALSRRKMRSTPITLKVVE